MKHKRLNNSSGFTLVELMVTVFLTAIAVIAIYRGYTSFSQSADSQQQVIEMQQNLRIGMYTLVKDIIRAGMNEEDVDVAGFLLDIDDNGTIDIVNPAREIAFSMDLGSGGVFANDGIDNDGDGDTDDNDSTTDDLEALEEARIGDGDDKDDGERIYYWLKPDEDTNLNGKLDIGAGEDVNGNNKWDSGELRREVWNGAAYVAQTIITNVSGLNFTYLDVDGNVLNPLVDPLDAIDSVEITLVVRTTNEDYRITNTETHTNQLGTWVWPEPPNPPQPNDNFRRRSMSMRVKVRNAQL